MVPVLNSLDSNRTELNRSDLSSPDLSTLQLNLNQPLQPQLHQQLVDWICSGRLSSGSKLISSRKLAESLNISRNTVTQVIEQLKSEGFLISYPAKGVFVNSALPSHVAAPDTPAWLSEVTLPELSKMAKDIAAFQTPVLRTVLPFTPGVPDLSAFPKKIWANLHRRHHDRNSLLGYAGSQGYLPLREALSQYLKLSRGVRCNPNQIIITNGAQEALSLCARLTLDQGDTALIENPGYQRARHAFLSQDINLKTIPLNNNYIDVKKLSQIKTNAKVLYTTPTHQYPLGGIMPASERMQLLDWANTTGTWIIEDDYDSEYAFSQKPVAALQGMAEKTPVLYAGSFSKTLFPSLRIGYLVVPEELVETFVTVKSHFSGETCLLNQAITADFIAEGHFVRHLRKMRGIYQNKWQHFHHLINQELSTKAKPTGISAGMHIALEVNTANDEQLRQQLMEQGFGGRALSSYYICKPQKQGLVVGFSNTNELQRIQYFETLKKLINAQK